MFATGDRKEHVRFITFSLSQYGYHFIFVTNNNFEKKYKSYEMEKTYSSFFRSKQLNMGRRQVEERKRDCAKYLQG